MIMEQMMQLTSMCEMVCQILQKKQEEKQIEEEQAANARYWKIPVCCDNDDDDDVDYTITITPVLSTEEPIDSLKISSGSTTTHSDISLPYYEVFYFDDDHIKEISSGSTTTHSEVSLSEYDSFTFDLSNDQCLPTDRSDLTHEKFADELAHIISPPEYDCFYFWNLPDPVELMSILNSEIRENLSTTSVNLPVEDDYSPLLVYVVWIFLAYLTYPVIPPYLHSFRNEDTIFDPDITINRFCSFKPGLSHQYGAFNKFNTHRSHLNEWTMIINGKNIPMLDVFLFHFYPP
nr:hypothetical protein [Tanacetum cinerariifolium]